LPANDGVSIFPLSVLQPCMVDGWVEWSEDYKPFAARPFADRQVWEGGSALARTALVAAKQLMTGNGYTQKQIRNAREHLSIATARSGFGSDTVVSWSLPQAQGDFALFRPAKSPETLHAREETEIGADEMVI